MDNLGAGLAALAFWGFLAAVVVAGIWYDLRKREAYQETVRRVVESGRELDDALLDKLLDEGASDSHIDRDMKLSALWILPIAPAMLILALVLGYQYPEALFPLLGVSGLLACLGAGFWIASKIAARLYKDDDSA